MLRITIAGANWPNNKKVYADEIMSAGSVYLFDFGNPAGVVTGIPANGAALPNIAWREFAANAGSGDAPSLAGVLQDTFVSGEAVTEITPKLGMHTMCRKASAIGSNHGRNIALPTAIRNYLFNNIAQTPTVAHEFFFSVWMRLTRSSSAALPYASWANVTNAPANYAYFFGVTSTLPFSTNFVNPSLGNIATPTLRNLKTSFYTGTRPSTTGGEFSWPAVWGPRSGPWGAVSLSDWPSWILYKAYCEDLTVSGRSYADVSALDNTLFTRDMLTVGGRFYGDTYSDPATIVP